MVERSRDKEEAAISVPMRALGQCERIIAARPPAAGTGVLMRPGKMSVCVRGRGGSLKSGFGKVLFCFPNAEPQPNPCLSRLAGKLGAAAAGSSRPDQRDEI